MTTVPLSWIRVDEEMTTLFCQVFLYYIKNDTAILISSNAMMSEDVCALTKQFYQEEDNLHKCTDKCLCGNEFQH